MLQEWKRKGKKFRHVEKDGEETTELSMKIRAAKFRDLPMSLRILIVNLSLFLILCAVFFMAGADFQGIVGAVCAAGGRTELRGSMPGRRLEQCIRCMSVPGQHVSVAEELRQCNDLESKTGRH